MPGEHAHITRAIYHLIGALYMDEAGTRALRQEERDLIAQLLAWEKDFKQQRADETRTRW